MLTVALGLASSLCWGISDFLGGLKSRTLELLTVMLVTQLVGLVLVAVVVALRGRGAPPVEDLAMAAAAGLTGLLGLAAFYRGLATGAMSVVAPIASIGAAIPVAAGLIEGERPGAVQLAGVALAVAGVAAASREHADEGGSARLAAGVGLALVAAVGIGLFLLTLDRAAEADLFWALLVARGTSTGVLAVTAAVVRPSLALGRPDAAALILVGVLDVAANGLFAAAASEGLVSLAAVLSSLYPAVTVMLAAVVLRERVDAGQRAGIVAVIAGVVLISAG